MQKRKLTWVLAVLLVALSLASCTEKQPVGPLTVKRPPQEAAEPTPESQPTETIKLDATEQLAQWHSAGLNYAKTLPITDYMDIVNNPETFDGVRIRTAGNMQALGENVVTNHVYFSFRDRSTNYTVISFSLKGCPQDMQDLSEEDQFVVISGVVEYSTFGEPRVEDCYIECVGEQAEEVSQKTETEWLQQFNADRNDYITTCSEYSYEELARYPNDNIGNHIAVSGRVMQLDVVAGDNVVLLDIGNNAIIYINYTGKQYHDPEILEDDQMVFYGECAGTKTYTTVLGDNNTIPLITALYSSINQSTQ